MQLKCTKAHAGLGGTERLRERYSLVLGRHHADDVLLGSEVELRDALEALLQVRLHAQRVLRLRQDLQQLVVRQEKESDTKNDLEK